MDFLQQNIIFHIMAKNSQKHISIVLDPEILLKLEEGKYNKSNKKKIDANNKIYRKINAESIRLQKQKSYKENREIIIAKVVNYERTRRNNDPLFKFKKAIRKSISGPIKKGGFTKKSKTFNILGCTFEEFKYYIESKFEPWMNWSNYGKYNGTLNYGWDIDHIIPVSSAKSEYDILKLNYYTNLQPLCSKVNRDIKRAK